MKKTICDVCGKEMPTFKTELPPEDVQFCISSYGHIWDVCDECRKQNYCSKPCTVRKQRENDMLKNAILKATKLDKIFELYVK